MKRIFHKVMQKHFWIQFLKQFSIVFVFFLCTKLVFREDDQSWLRLSLSALVTSFLIAFVISFQYQAGKNASQDESDTLQDLQLRNWKWYLGLFGFSLLFIFVLFSIFVAIAIAIFLLFIQSDENIWAIAGKTYLTGVIVAFLLTIATVINDRYKIRRLQKSGPY